MVRSYKRSIEQGAREYAVQCAKLRNTPSREERLRLCREYGWPEAEALRWNAMLEAEWKAQRLCRLRELRERALARAADPVLTRSQDGETARRSYVVEAERWQRRIERLASDGDERAQDGTGEEGRRR